MFKTGPLSATLCYNIQSSTYTQYSAHMYTYQFNIFFFTKKGSSNPFQKVGDRYRYSFDYFLWEHICNMYLT